MKQFGVLGGKAERPDGLAEVRSAAIKQAAQWRSRHQLGTLSADEKVAFMQWLRGSPLHVEEYLALAQMNADLPLAARLLLEANPGLATQTPDLEVSPSVVALSRSGWNEADYRELNGQRLRAGRWRVAAMVVALAAAALLYWQLSAPGILGLPRDLAAKHGEQRVVRMRDGTVARLNTDTQLHVQYSGAERLVVLNRGQALFDVAKDSTRPFRVRIGRTDIVAVGTEFVVYRKAATHVIVTVLEGRVDVTPSADASRPRNEQLIHLRAGEQFELDTIERHSAAVPADVRASVAWIDHEIVFNQRPLGEVIAEFERYSAVPVLIEEPGLEGLRISGNFKTYDLDSFLGFLQQFQDLDVERDAHAIHVRRK